MGKRFADPHSRGLHEDAGVCYGRLSDEAEKRLLILACSRRKRPDSDLLPAIERYDGPTFRVLRKFLREYPEENLDTFVLSAEFGLIPSNYPTPLYERRMTSKRAREIRPSVESLLRQMSRLHMYQRIFVLAGSTYSEALPEIETKTSAELQVSLDRNSPGGMVSTLYDWLYGEPPVLGYDASATKEDMKVRIRGIEISLSPEQIQEQISRSLSVEKESSKSYKAWYVEVDGQRVAPKWIISKLTGLRVNEFNTSDACKALTRLGVVVRRE